MITHKWLNSSWFYLKLPSTLHTESFVMDVLIFWKLNKHLKNILWIIEYRELPQNIKTFMFSTT